MKYVNIETPAVLIDLEKVENNLIRAQAYADKHALPLRPHIKTHKLVRFAKWQIRLGAIGITCQKLGEAEVMAAGGMDDILLTYNIIGEKKLKRLKVLHQQIKIGVVADSDTVVAGYADVFADANLPLRVLIECDTGMGRCGVQTPQDTLALAQQITKAKGLKFDGLMTYPPAGQMAQTDEWLIEARELLTSAGMPPATISVGGTPDFFQAAEISSTTEYRPGTYIYSDRMQVAFGHGNLSDCALSVLASVVSTPTPTRVILDAGSKALAADLSPAPGHGSIIEYPQAHITTLNEEHAIVDMSACRQKPKVGDKVRVIPNHACVVSNLVDEVYLMRGDSLEETARVDARGQLI